MHHQTGVSRVFLCALMPLLAIPAAAQITLEPIGTFRISDFGDYSEIFDEGAAEIAEYDAESQRLFITNGAKDRIDIVDISDPTSPSLVDTIDITPYGEGVTSVAVRKEEGEIGVSITSDPLTDPGKAVFFDTDGNFLSQVTVGAFPDMITFTPNGRLALTANEGQPSDDYTVDPEGSLSIINVSEGAAEVTQGDVCTAGFTSLNGQEDLLNSMGIRIFGPDASASQDLEPEYIAVSQNSRTAWVSLQENNAIAEINLTTCQLADIFPLGFKDHLIEGNALDASNRDGIIHIVNWPVLGMYQPDAIAAFRAGGRDYLVTANEGDARDYDGFSEEARVGSLDLSDELLDAFGADLGAPENLGRLKVTTTLGSDENGVFEQLYAYGARSFSIFTTDGELVFDSGDDFEQITAFVAPEGFNTDNDDNDSFDGRSDDKGPEPEGLALGKVRGRTYVFVGLERVGGVMVYDISNPFDPSFVEYENNRDFGGDAAAGTAGDLGPESLAFIKEDDSPTDTPLLVVANEVSGDTTIYEVRSTKTDG